MKKNIVSLWFVSAIPFAISSAWAQSQPTVPEAATAPDQGAYSLKIPTAPASQVGVKGYELSSTTISGSSGASAVILTAPVGSDAAYKTESGIYFYPHLFVGIGNDDNVRANSVNPISSTVVKVAPQLIGEIKRKGDRYTALASVSNVNYDSSSADNTTNSELTVAGDNYFTARARAAWSLGQVRSTDPRGSTYRVISAEPDRWTSNNVEGRFIYGAPEAQGRVEFDVGNQNKTYDNNRVNTAIADVTVGTYAGRLFYRLGTRSLALGEIRSAKSNYASSFSTDSNTDRRYYLGLTWDATAATTGIVKVGRMTKDYDFAGRDGYNGDSWEAAIRWMPRTYSAVDLQTARSTVDATGLGNYAVTTNTNLNWNTKWTQSLTSRAGFGVLKTDFAGTSRSDSATNFALTVDYAVMRWLKVGIDWALTDNASNVPTAAYKRNVTMLTLNASL